MQIKDDLKTLLISYRPSSIFHFFTLPAFLHLRSLLHLCRFFSTQFFSLNSLIIMVNFFGKKKEALLSFALTYLFAHNLKDFNFNFMIWKITLGQKRKFSHPSHVFWRRNRENERRILSWLYYKLIERKIF